MNVQGRIHKSPAGNMIALDDTGIDLNAGLHLVRCLDGKVVEIKELSSITPQADHIQIEISEALRLSMQWIENVDGDVYCADHENQKFHEPDLVDPADPLSVAWLGTRIVENILAQ